MKPRIFLTRSLPLEVMTRLKQRVQLTCHCQDRPLSKLELIRGIRKAEGLIAMLNDSIDRKVLKEAPQLKIIANYAVGTNNIDLEEAARRDMVVTNTPGVLTDATADLTWGLLLAVARRIPEGESLVRSGRWSGWAPTQLVGGEISGTTLGIIGMGRIGRAVARRGMGFSMEIIYYSRSRLPVREERHLRIRYRSFPDLLRESDFVSLHVPSSDETRHLINGQALRSMKRTAYLVNTARGPIVDERALIQALRRAEIAGAGLDVFEDEPCVSLSLRKIKNVVLLPHLGSATTQTRLQMGRMVLDNLEAFFSGKKIPNRVN